jgi:hypothetical protein
MMAEGYYLTVEGGNGVDGSGWQRQKKNVWVVDIPFFCLEFA